VGADLGTWASGLSRLFDVTSGKDAINASSGARLADEIEYDVGAVCDAEAEGSFFDGLRARIRYGWVTDSDQCRGQADHRPAHRHQPADQAALTAGAGRAAARQRCRAAPAVSSTGRGALPVPAGAERRQAHRRLDAVDDEALELRLAREAGAVGEGGGVVAQPS
jgi:hypothetical protein